MFLPPDIERKRQVRKWVAAAMNATTLIQADIANGVIPVAAVQGIMHSILEAAVKEILSVPSVHSEPSVN